MSEPWDSMSDDELDERIEQLEDERDEIKQRLSDTAIALGRAYGQKLVREEKGDT